MSGVRYFYVTSVVPWIRPKTQITVSIREGCIRCIRYQVAIAAGCKEDGINKQSSDTMRLSEVEELLKNTKQYDDDMIRRCMEIFEPFREALTTDEIRTDLKRIREEISKEGRENAEKKHRCEIFDTLKKEFQAKERELHDELLVLRVKCEFLESKVSGVESKLAEIKKIANE